MRQSSLEQRLSAVEAHQRISQLPIRYALAIDQRDLDDLATLFGPDVDMGSRGKGRQALTGWYADVLTGFYRSVHLICGHHIVLANPDVSGTFSTATGQVYCRAEHEVGNRWIVMAIRYDDAYHSIDGEWYFERRKESHWYKADVTERPPEISFEGWPQAPAPAQLPHLDSSWAQYWSIRDHRAVTEHP